MNHAKYQPRHSLGRTRPSRQLIRSPAFKKKYQEGMPKINEKQIPFHYLYNIQLPNKPIQNPNPELEFWGCLMPHKKQSSPRKIATSVDIRKPPTRGETIFKQYMQKRPSLTVTARTYNLTNRANQQNQAWTEIRSEKVVSPTEQNYASEKVDEKEVWTSEELIEINKKSLYQMTHRELEVSIEWKKKFLQLFEEKFKDGRKLKPVLKRDKMFY